MIPETLIHHITAHSPCVVMLVGTPGAGKSTLAAALADQLGAGAAVLSYAAHREEVCGDPADPAADPAAGALLRKRLIGRCAARLTTIVDGVHHLERSRAQLRAIADNTRLSAVAVVLTTPQEVCLARQRDRPQPAPGKQHGLRVPDTQVRDMAEAIQDARDNLAREGFAVHVLDPGDTAGPLSEQAATAATATDDA